MTSGQSLGSKALVIGCATIDCTWVVDKIPTGDDKKDAAEYSFSFGGNAPTAAFGCAKLGSRIDMICPLANDRLSRVYLEMANEYGITIFPRPVSKFPLSGVFPNDGKRAIVTGRKKDFAEFPRLEVDGYRILHVDRHQPEAARHYALMCRDKGILTSLDVGGFEETTDELIGYMDVVLVSERFCQDIQRSPDDVLDYLRQKGCKVGGVTLSEFGMIWYEGSGKNNYLAALQTSTVDSLGAGDVFRGGYMYSYLAWPEQTWKEHFKFARAASAHAVQFLGNEDSLPTLTQVEHIMRTYSESPNRPAWLR